jgi:hypothetical protein
VSQFVKDVARQIERRRARRKLIWWCAIAALVVIAFVYLRCGRGWGIGGDGSGSGSGNGNRSGVATPADARTACTIHVAKQGITVDGKRTSREAAVAACRGAFAHVAVYLDVREGDWLELREALDAAGVRHSP